MGAENEVLRIQKKLIKMLSGHGADQEQALELLKTLKKIPVNLELLTTTRIGMTVNALRKSSKDEEVIALSKTLIKNWKKFLAPSSNKEKDVGPSSSAKKKEDKSNKNKDDGDSKKDRTSADSGDFKPKDDKKTKDSKKKSFCPAPTADAVRLKCRELIANALRDYTSIDDCGTPEELAGELEEAIFQEFQNTDTKYRNKFRSRLANLKDSRNPNLRTNFLKGVITPDELATMTVEEMATDDLKALREKWKKESIVKSQLAQIEGTKCDMIKCRKCKKNNCTYTQSQTRSADEPMTTFVYCTDCGTRWKFC